MIGRQKAREILDALAGHHRLPWWLEIPRVILIAALIGTAITLLVSASHR
ncbi:hypothetical protein [Glycomyces tenuis]|nr:hypothetical protein [Glycomyces tenuis]